MPNVVRRPRQCRPLRQSERTRDHARSDLLHWPSEAIAVATGLPRTAVQSALRSGVESPKKQTGRKPIITRKVRERLVARATLDAAHHRMTYTEITWLEGVQAGKP
ncbi:hypothetical protein FGG08_006858 [Glutinoglossum americanum]|uniref:Uncharacterized protein n=1 Tax=Glutinoglossum americanum TaxID=1670608 RepID=A0A9P8I6H3_9PEZI|nr:hypothetical protein FGG08_006858 [Glutinoglossum americanum]